MKERDCGFLEEQIIKEDCICLTFVEINATLQSKQLERAIDIAQKKYPNLCLNVNTETKPIRFRSVKDKPNFTLSKVYSEKEWETFLEEKQNCTLNFNDDKPLWEVIAVQINDEERTKLVVLYYHAIGDGTSGQIIINDLLLNYEQLEADKDYEVPPSRSLVFLPHIEDLLFPEASHEDRAKAEIMKDKLISERCNWKPSIEFERGIAAEKGKGVAPQNAFLLKEIPKDIFCRFKALCKEKNTTVTVLLLCALQFAVAKLAILTNLFSFPWIFQHDSDANLRDRMSPMLGDEHVALLIGIFSVSLTFETLDMTFSDCINHIDKNLKLSLQNKEPQIYHVASRLLYEEGKKAEITEMTVEKTKDKENKEDSRQQPIEHDRSSDLNFSNVGLYKFKTTFNKFSISSIYTIGNFCGPFFGTHVFLIQTVNDTMCFTWTYEKSNKNKIAAEYLISCIQDLICFLCEDGERINDLTLKSFVDCSIGANLGI